MFKSKWQKKYEKAMNKVEFWRDFHEEQAKYHDISDPNNLIHSGQRVALQNILCDMKRIAEES